jgi:hypothetical protein
MIEKRVLNIFPSQYDPKFSGCSLSQDPIFQFSNIPLFYGIDKN